MPGQRAGAKRRRSQERPADPGRRARLWDGLQRPALQPADAHRQEQYRPAGAEVGLLDQRQPRRGGVPGRQGRRDLHHRPQHDGGRRCADRQAALAHRARLSAGDAARRVLRHRESRRRDLQRDDHPVASGQPDHRHGRQDRQGHLAGQIAGAGNDPERLRHDGCAADRQWRHHRRRGRRGIQHSRLPRRIRCSHREASLAPVHGARARREGYRNLGRGLRAYGRRQQLGDGQLRSGIGSGLLGHRQPGPLEPARPQR